MTGIGKDLFSVLEEEHQEILNLIDNAEEAGEKERNRLIGDIKNQWLSHARSEEKTLYSLLRERAEEDGEDGTVELVSDSFDDHEEADRLLNELVDMDTADEMWTDHLLQLKECIEVHVEDEEDELFPQARELLSGNELATLLNEYRELKAEFEEEWEEPEVLGRTA